jgi:hypothetical protein
MGGRATLFVDCHSLFARHFLNQGVRSWSVAKRGLRCGLGRLLWDTIVKFAKHAMVTALTSVCNTKDIGIGKHVCTTTVLLVQSDTVSSRTMPWAEGFVGHAGCLMAALAEIGNQLWFLHVLCGQYCRHHLCYRACNVSSWMSARLCCHQNVGVTMTCVFSSPRIRRGTRVSSSLGPRRQDRPQDHGRVYGRQGKTHRFAQRG